MKLSLRLVLVTAIAALAACDNAPKPNQPAGADCNAGLSTNACVAGHFCARPETDQAGQQRFSNGGLFGLGLQVPVGRCVRLPAVGQGCTFVNRDCVAGATCQFEGASRAGICRANAAPAQ
ncbi:MAG: hypothetical protein JNK05_10365 [Myxococcales bacterium]|nr:hypothetical protein [Myxococcales bacterium]